MIDGLWLKAVLIDNVRKGDGGVELTDAVDGAHYNLIEVMLAHELTVRLERMKETSPHHLRQLLLDGQSARQVAKTVVGNVVYLKKILLI